MTTKTACPNCESENVYYLYLSKLWTCPKCGPIVPEETEGPDDPPPPCRVCGTHSVDRDPVAGLVCRQCGSNQAYSPKRGTFLW